jgi:hypothetical protein
LLGAGGADARGATAVAGVAAGALGGAATGGVGLGGGVGPDGDEGDEGDAGAVGDGGAVEAVGACGSAPARTGETNLNAGRAARGPLPRGGTVTSGGGETAPGTTRACACGSATGLTGEGCRTSSAWRQK